MNLSNIIIFKSIFFISFISVCVALFTTIIFQYNSYEMIENEIIRKDESLKDTILNQLSSLFLLIFIATNLFYFISRKVTILVDENIKNLIEAFKEVTTRHKEINLETLTYKEFSLLAQ